MYENKTSFILGAGASWHYGFPTGARLIEETKEAAKTLEQLCGSLEVLNAGISWKILKHYNGRINALKADFAAFIQRLEQVDPVIIDYFLGQNPKLAMIGRFLIAFVILRAQSRNPIGRNSNRPNTKPPGQAQDDNWIRFVVHQLTTNCQNSSDLLKNEVRFITFNYEDSFEKRMRRALSSIELFSSDDIGKFLEKPRIYHVYGLLERGQNIESLRDFSIVENRATKLFDTLSQLSSLINAVYEASDGIQVIDPAMKEVKKMEETKSYIASSDNIYILGFGFDEINCKRLGLRDLKRGPQKHLRRTIRYTNFNDANRVNKQVAMILHDSPDQFHQGAHLLKQQHAGCDFIIDKSVRNVYDAFLLDFDDYNLSLNESGY